MRRRMLPPQRAGAVRRPPGSPRTVLRWIVPAVMLGAAGIAPAASPDASAPYVDRLIDDRAPGDGEVLSGDEGEDATPGLTSLLAEGRWYSRRSSQAGDLDEFGLYLLSRRETLNYGDLFVEAAGRSAHGDGGFFPYDRARSNRVLLQQVNMPLAEGWSLSNALGVARSLNAGPFASGYRFNLPTTMFSGFQSMLASPRTTLSVEAGDVTQLEGYQALGARRLDARATGAAWTQRLAERWEIGFKGLQVDSSLDAGDYRAWTAALAHTSRDDHLRWIAQAMADDRHHAGQWFEGDWREGPRRSRWSVWNLDPSLYWYSTLLSNGQRGVALQHDHTDLRYAWGAGVEVARNDPLQPGRAPADQTRLSLSGSLRIDRSTSIGTVGQWRRLSPRFDDGWSLEQRYSALGLILSRARAAVSDRLEYNWVRHVADQRSSLHELLWTRDVTLSDERSIGFTLGYGRERTRDGSHQRPSVGVAYNGPLGAGGGTLSGTCAMRARATSTRPPTAGRARYRRRGR